MLGRIGSKLFQSVFTPLQAFAYPCLAVSISFCSHTVMAVGPTSAVYMSVVTPPTSRPKAVSMATPRVLRNFLELNGLSCAAYPSNA